MGKRISHGSHQTHALDSIYYSNSQFSCDIFPPVEVTRVSRRDNLQFLRDFPSTGTDHNVGSTTNLAWHLVRTFYARTLRGY